MTTIKTSFSKLVTPSWVFEPAPITVEDPRDEEAFQENGIHKEGAQNPKDAQLDRTKPARIRYSLRDIPHAIAQKYTNGIDSHIDSCHQIAPTMYSVEPLANDCQVLLIEDFNTTGLLGPLEHEPDLDNRPHNFVGLMFSSGAKYNKKGDNLGSRGQGKSTYTAASKIRCWIVYSVRHSSPESVDPTPRVLFGRTTMRSHYVGHDHFSRNGHWGEVLTQDNKVRALPVTDAGTIDTFVKDFQLARKSNESGTTIAILHYKGDRNLDTFTLRQLQENYALVLRGGLELEFDLEGNGKTLQIGVHTIEQYVRARQEATESAEWMTLLTKVLDLKWLLDIIAKKGQVIDLPCVTAGTTPDSYIKTLSKHLIDHIVQKYRDDERVLIRVPAKITEKLDGAGTKNHDGEMYIAIIKDSEGQSHWPEFLRDGLRIAPANNESMIRNKVAGIRTIFAVFGGLENGMQVMLRAAEPGAHDRWTHETEGFTEGWEKGKIWVQFAKQSPAAFADLARGISDELNYDAFPFLVDPKTDDFTPGGDGGEGPPEGKRRKGRKHTGGGGGGGAPVPKVLFAPLEKNGKVGILARLTPDVVTSHVLLTACYDNAQGRASSKYDPNDFDFETMVVAKDITVSAGKITAALGNQLLIQIDDVSKFKVEILGFDRRLIIIPGFDFTNGTSL